MSFKDNLLKKIQIDDLSKTIIAAWGPAGSGRRIEKEDMRKLLQMGPFVHRRERDLDLYIQQPQTDPPHILVLDNDLNMYASTVADVTMRKSPLIKEMVSIRNAIKILSDADVVVSKKEASVKTVQEACIAQLDLTFTEADLNEIAEQGRSALENKYADGVIESLKLLAELMGFEAPPKGMQIRHCMLWGYSTSKSADETVFGPLILFSRIDNGVKWVEEPISSLDKKKIEYLKQIAAGTEAPTMEGPDVFAHLETMVSAKRL
jgi:hypothetical protein